MATISFIVAIFFPGDMSSSSTEKLIQGTTQESNIIESSTAIQKATVASSEEYDNNYEIGLKYLEKKSYSDAIKYFRLVPSSSSNYNLAEEKLLYAESKFKEITLNKVNSFIDNNDYYSAINELLSAQKILNNDNDLMMSLEDCSNRLRKVTNDNISKYLADSNYSAANEEINNALAILPNDTELQAIKRTIEEYKPVRLTDLDYFERHYENDTWNVPMKLLDSEIDNLGNKRMDIIEGGYFEYTYIINEKYSKMTGVLFIKYDYRSIKQKGRLKVYGNDVLLYSDEVTGGEFPKEFNINISGITKLKVCFRGYDGSWTSGTKYYACLSETMLTK